MSDLEQLKAARDSAWNEYDILRAPADVAYGKYKTSDKVYKEAVMYEKAKREVMRDLIKAAGDTVANDTSSS